MFWFSFLLFFHILKTGSPLLQLLKRVLQRCSAAKFQKYFVDYRHLTFHQHGAKWIVTEFSFLGWLKVTSDWPSWETCRPWLDLLLLSALCSHTSQPSSPLVAWQHGVHSPGLALPCCKGVLGLWGLCGLCGLCSICGVRWLLLSRGFGGGGVRGRGFSSWYCNAKSKSGLGGSSEVEKVMRSSTTGGSEMRGLGGEISGSEGVRSPREEGLVRGGTRGGISRQRPSPMEARMEPPPSKARWVLLTRPPREPLSGLGEPAGEEPPSSLHESRWGRGSRRLSFSEEPAERENMFLEF